MMNRTTVSIANLHDGVALTEEEATLIANALGYAWSYDPAFYTDDERLLLETVDAILRGKRRDGSEREEHT